MKRRKGRKPLDKESKAEDWCFCCKDGGELLICDYKECLKAYHCKCVGKDDSFMSSGKLWSCDWHFCRSCRKASRYYCLCCPSAVCSSCAYIQDFVQIKGKYGMCTHCLKLALLIEENMNVDSDGEQVEFDSVDTLEGLFKEYYELKKGTLGLNSKVLRSAKRRLTMGRNYPSDSEADQYDEVGDNHLTSDDESMDDSEGERKRKRSKGKQSLNRQKGRSSKMEFDGWASKSLIQFLRLIGKDTNESLSEQEVTSIINDYIRHHKLSDPKMKKRILCDAYLQSLFRKKVVHKNKIKDLLEAHFYENQQESDEVEDEMECDLDVDNYKGKEKGKREAPKKKREREASVPQSRFAAIVGENLKLVYLKKSLVYELHKQPESFKDKITGCFVRAKAHPHDIYQRNSHLLMRVTGVKQALHVEKNSDTVLLVSEFPGEISMSKLSDCDFSEEECQNLTGRVKAGLLQKPTLVDLEKKARILHKDITKHWIDKELKLLKNRIDLANEKGWRQELFEYRERRDLLQTQSQQDRLLNNIPTVVPDVEGVESYYNEDNKTDQVDLPAPTNTLTSPGSLPDAEEVNSFFDEDDKTNLGDSQIPCYAQAIPINLPDLEEAKSVCDEDNKIDQGELPAPANTLTCPRSLPEVEMIEPICDEDNKSKLVGSPTPNHTQTSQRSLPGLEVVKFSCDEDNKTDKGESPTAENTWTCNRSLPVQDDALLRKTFQQSTSDEHIKGSCSHAEPQPEKSTPSISASETKQNLHACFTGVMSNDKSAGVTDVIDLSSDDESEDRSSRAIDAEAKSENPELYAWHISGPFVEKSKTYSLSLLKKWSEMSPYAKKIKVWKESQTESDAILLGDAIKLAFPRG